MFFMIYNDLTFTIIIYKTLTTCLFCTNFPCCCIKTCWTINTSSSSWLTIFINTDINCKLTLFILITIEFYTLSSFTTITFLWTFKTIWCQAWALTNTIINPWRTVCSSIFFTTRKTFEAIFASIGWSTLNITIMIYWTI